MGGLQLKNLRFVVLNSAWFARDENDKNKLWIGLPQIELLQAGFQLAQPDNYDKEMITISIHHHPHDWLNEEELDTISNRLNTYRYLSERSHIILSGHTHGAHEAPHRMSNRALLFKGGATYLGNSYRNNISILQIDKEKRTCKRYKFEFDPRYGRWKWDIDDEELSLVANKTQAAVAPAITWDLKKDGSPYPGLMHFTRRHAPVFFGREAELRDILDRLNTPKTRFILVSGDSGVGKSSFVYAGLLPKLEESGLPDGHDCLSVRMVPSQGLDPFDALMRALHVQAERAGLGSYTLGEQLRDKPADRPDRIGKIIAKGIDRSALLLFLDQMEELFTGKAREYADTFLTALHGATLKNALWVIATIRSDYLHHCERRPALLQVLRSQGYYPLGSVDPTIMADMIKKPAQCAGLEIADGLVRRIIGESGTDSGSLPLMAFVLRRLFDQRSGPALTEQVYNSFNGIDGAVAHHVSDVEHKLRTKIGEVLNDLMPKLFQAVLVVDQEGLPTRRRARLGDFNNELGVLVEELIRARLFSTEGEGGGMDSTVSIAHEKLFDAWPRLERWITENKDDLWLRRQLSQAATEWEARGQEEKYRWSDDRVIDVVGMLKRLGMGIDDLSDEERLFLGPIDRKSMLLELNDLATTDKQRASIGVRLELLGDKRPGVGVRQDGLPDIVWCEVPEGEIALEEKAGTFRVKPFNIAKYPVTWIQYRAFLEADDGYKDPIWWQRLDSQVEESHLQFNERDNHPVVNVTWWEAVAFCEWLKNKLGFEIRLPTEWEWQQAATGGDPHNKYPWGPAWKCGYANTIENRLQVTTAVGLYPHGASPVGALDMIGNVWEWCLDELENIRRDEPSVENLRSVRGGSWLSDQDTAHCGYRDNGDVPLHRLNRVGFRLFCSSPILGSTVH